MVEVSNRFLEGLYEKPTVKENNYHANSLNDNSFRIQSIGATLDNIINDSNNIPADDEFWEDIWELIGDEPDRAEFFEDDYAALLEEFCGEFRTRAIIKRIAEGRYSSEAGALNEEGSLYGYDIEYMPVGIIDLYPTNLENDEIIPYNFVDYKLETLEDLDLEGVEEKTEEGEDPQSFEEGDVESDQPWLAGPGLEKKINKALIRAA